jgi:hypothetical protein
MLNEPTLEKLRSLRLAALADAWLEQQGNADLQALGFDERLAMLVDAEWLDRQNKKLARNLREAKLRLGQAAVEDIDYPARRKLEKTVIRQLATCTWVEAHHNIIITGATGAGKTFIACALAQQACRKGYRALYGPTHASSPSWLGSTCSSWMTGAWCRWAMPSGEISSRSSRIGTATAQRSSQASCPRRAGTITSATPRSPMRSAIVCSTTRTKST